MIVEKKIKEIKFSDFFKNKKSIPPRGSDAYDKLVKEEEARCLGGGMVDGVFFSGWLYWHLNHWWIRDDIEDEYENIVRRKLLPSLRDNEWIVAQYLEECRVEKKGYLHIGVRQFGKSEIMASYQGYHATLFQNTQNVIVGGNDSDLSLLKDKIDFGLKNLWEGLRIPMLDKDWRKPMVRLGLKAKDNDDEVWSYLIIRNVADGKNTEGPAGVTAKAYATDEIGKFPFAQSFEAAKPAFKSKFGWRCVPLLFGCVCAGTKVWTNNGNFINIENLVPENGIIGYNGEESSKEIITYWQPPFEKPCYKIATNTGRYLECSEDHPILYRARDEKEGHRSKRVRKVYFKEAKDIQVGNQIAVIENVDIFSEKEMWEPRVVGWLIGDGSYGFDKTPVLSNCDLEINSYIENNLNTKTESTYLTKDGRVYKETRIKDICKELRKIGIYGQTKLKKTLPIEVHSYSKYAITELLGGLFDTDGTVGGYNKGIPIIALAASSEFLLKEVQFLLQKLGIHCTIKRIKANIKGGRKDRNDHYRLSICDKKSIKMFYEQISFYVKYKQENLSKCVERLNSKKEQIPKELKGIRLERVVSVEYIGIKPVYNLTAGTTNTYIANGIVTHNTGGSFEKGADAERFFYHPDANNFLAITDPITAERTCVFMSGLYRLDCKYETTLGDYLRKEGKITHDTKELDKIPFHASDKIKALETIKAERANKALDPDQTEYLKLIMYYPLTPKECFLSSSENYFNGDIARNQKERLEVMFPGLKVGMYVDLYEEEDIVKHKPSTRLPVSSFPKGPKEDTNCPIVILEHPGPVPPYGLFVAGIDPYRFEKAPNSDSLGAIYIFKRAYDALSDNFQDMPVAWYVARPDSKDTWNNNVRLLIKYYNAIALCENDEMSFIDYMIAKGDGHMLMDTPDWIKEYSPTSSANLRQKGVSSSPRNIELFNTNLKQYMEEYFASAPVPGSEETRKVLGVAKIYDSVLLDEIIKWNKDGNFDRIRALSIAITCARKMDLQRIQPQVEDNEPQVVKPKRRRSGPFKEMNSTIFGPRGSINRLFK